MEVRPICTSVSHTSRDARPQQNNMERSTPTVDNPCKPSATALAHHPHICQGTKNLDLTLSDSPTSTSMHSSTSSSSAGQVSSSIAPPRGYSTLPLSRGKIRSLNCGWMITGLANLMADGRRSRSRSWGEASKRAGEGVGGSLIASVRRRLRGKVGSGNDYVPGHLEIPCSSQPS
jgi:hypothetical protein